MPAQISCIFTKALIPWIEREVGREGVTTILEMTGQSREHLIAEYNRIPLELADRLAHRCMAMTGEQDEERWAERFAEACMDWKPSREERGWAGAYTMSLGNPRAIYERGGHIVKGFGVHEREEVLAISRRRATIKLTPPASARLPRWGR